MTTSKTSTALDPTDMRSASILVAVIEQHHLLMSALANMASRHQSERVVAARARENEQLIMTSILSVTNSYIETVKKKRDAASSSGQRAVADSDWRPVVALRDVQDDEASDVRLPRCQVPSLGGASWEVRKPPRPPDHPPPTGPPPPPPTTATGP